MESRQICVGLETDVIPANLTKISDCSTLRPSKWSVMGIDMSIAIAPKARNSRTEMREKVNAIFIDA
jgi:hypothetical protein